jgi:hypothetical protein
MPALLINLKIDVKEKFEFFKVTLGDLSGLFEECHIKIRGIYSRECVEYAKGQLGNGIHFYQELQESDWVAATLEILGQVTSRSVFLYFEDHRLVASRQRLEQALEDFDRYNLDHMCYSFFKASQLDVKNLLPLGAIQRELFSEFYLSKNNLNLIGKISPHYCTFSLVSMVSVEYFKEILTVENKKIKIFDRKLIAILTRMFPHPRYRKVISTVNANFSWLNLRLCISDPTSPFNLEKVWYESILNNQRFKFGILKQELFANYDDDNGAYGESLIKRGLYPFDPHYFDMDDANNLNNVVSNITLNKGESIDCTYYSHNGRIRHAPKVQINVVRGSINVHYKDAFFSLSSGQTKFFYSNMSPVINCIEFAELEIKIFDDIFK